jgi:DNA-binding transcriptional LysR family regulator
MKSNDFRLERVDLNKLVTFLVIVEAGGVTAASRQLALTRSAISHSLTALEASLGVALFHRVGKAMVLTPEGKRLAAVVAETRERLAEAVGETVGASADVRGVVRVGLFTGFSRFRIAAAVDHFVREHAGARVRVAFGPQTWLAEELTAGRLDFTLSLRPAGASSAGVRSEKLFEQSLVLATGAGRSRRVNDFAAIQRLALVDYYQSDPLIDRWTRHHFGSKRVGRQQFRAWVASTDLAVELVARGTGAAVLPADVAEPFERDGSVAILRGPREPMREPIYLNQLSSGRSARVLPAFRESLTRGGAA